MLATNTEESMRRIAYTTTGLALMAVMSPPALAQTPATTTASPAVSVEVRQAMDKVAAALKAVTTFEIKVNMTTEDVLETGQRLQSTSVVTINGRRPNRLFVDVDSIRKSRQYFYDGKQLTIYGPRQSYYATIAAPPTTRQLIDELADRGVDTPLADLFQWGDTGVPLGKVTSAFFAGSDKINGQICDHYAFRQPDVDWQIWVNQTGPALPCKVAIVNTKDPSQPETTAVLQWTTGADIAESRFQFTPPADAKRIELAQAAGASQGATK